MQKIIDHILESNFNYENRYLDFSCTKIDIVLTKARIYEGSFHIYGPTGVFTHGNVFASDRRMEILTKKFSGTEEEIYYRFRGEEMEEGEVLRGSVFVVSNQGEFSLPFTVIKESTSIETSCGAVKNLSQFTTLARSNWREAVTLFYSSEFVKVFDENDACFLDAYKALSVNRGSETAVEEFLIYANKKQRCEFVIQENQLTIPAARDASLVTEHEISILKNGWGYTELFIQCEGDFVFTEKEVIREEDFLGNVCRLPVFIDRNQCHRGENYGKITLYNSFFSLELPVRAKGETNSTARAISVAEKQNILQLMRIYQNFRAQNTDTADWLRESGKIVDKMIAQDDKNMQAKLFKAQLLITEGRNQEAEWILDQAAVALQDGAVDETVLAYYYYLTSLINRDPEYVNRVTAEVEHIYRKDNTNWRAAWLLLFLSEEYHKSATGKWVFLEKQYTIGCTSPLLYVEAVVLLNSNPSLLRRLGEFEQQVVWYGIRQKMLVPDVIEQLLYLSDRVKEYSYTLFRSLNRLYEEQKDPRMLQQVCSLLIKGDKTGEEYFRWYRDGVEQNLHITNLYEYYMLSINLEKEREIPKRVLMYFSYQNDMDYEHTAYIYDYILANSTALRDIYAAYKGKIEYFALEQILRMRLNKPLANIYGSFLQPGIINDDTCEALSRILFGHLIKVKNPDIAKILVYMPGKVEPEEYEITEGKTWVPLYGSDYTIVLEDMYGNRFLKSVDYTVEKVMFPGKYLQQLEKFSPDNLSMDLYFLNEKKGESLTEPQEVERALRTAASEGVEPALRHKLMLKVLMYYYEKDAFSSMDEYMKNLPMDAFSPKERGEVMQFMILREKYDLAANCLASYGPYFVDTKLLVRLLDNLMDKNGMTENTAITNASLYAFRKGRYDSTVLYYLCRYYRGSTREARDIWKVAKTYQIDCHRLCELMLVQMLYTGAFIQEKMEVFRYYVQNGADPSVEGAFLAHCAYDYYLRDKSFENIVFDEIRHMSHAGLPLLRICKIAFLKYYSNNPAELTDEAKATADVFLEELMNQGVHLEFFRAFTYNSQVEQEMADKVIFEYHSKPAAKARVHYCIVNEGEQPGDVRGEYLREICNGIFIKEFVLFFGETVEYYVTEDGVLSEEDGSEQVLESGTLEKENPESGAGRYKLVNDVIVSQVKGDFEKMDVLLEKYYKREYLNSKLFGLK